jgi:hypothetical protein
MPVVNGFFLPSNGANAELAAAKFDVYSFDPLTRATSFPPIGSNIVALFDTGAGSTVINSKPPSGCVRCAVCCSERPECASDRQGRLQTKR